MPPRRRVSQKTQTPAKKPPAKKPTAKKPAVKKATAKKAAATPNRRFCSLCGAVGTDGPGGIPPGWSFETGERGLVFQCGDCVRRNIRAIEGRLPQEWWE